MLPRHQGGHFRGDRRGRPHLRERQRLVYSYGLPGWSMPWPHELRLRTAIRRLVSVLKKEPYRALGWVECIQIPHREPAMTGAMRPVLYVVQIEHLGMGQLRVDRFDRRPRRTA